MAIVKMKRLTLLAMKADEDKIFDAFVKSNAVQLKRSEDIPCCVTENTSVAMEKLLEKSNAMEAAIYFLKEQSDAYNTENKKDKSVEKVSVPKNSFSKPLTEIDYDYFLGFGKNAEKIDAEVSELLKLKDEAASLNVEIAKKTTEREKFLPLKELPHPTTWYKDTEHATVQLCQLPSSEADNALKLAESFDLVQMESVIKTPSVTTVVVVAHKSQTSFFEQAAAYGLVKCPVTCDILPSLVLKNIDDELKKLRTKLKEVKKKIVAYDARIPEWKIYVDYLNLCVKKAEASGELQQTDQTFVLEGYYPAEKEEEVQQAIAEFSDRLILSFDEIGEDEFAPTLTKNNKIVKQFEFVTNMYTPPEYHEIDPNPVMAVFYFIIFGFMVADIGYGLLLVLAGVVAHFAIKQNSGIKTILQLFGICGVAAIAVGALFGSCFSYYIYQGVIPDPSEFPMLMIVLSIFLGVCHIMAGVACKMALKIKNKQYLAAWLSDFPWLFVLAGLVLAIWNAAIDMMAYEPYQALKLPQLVCNIGLYVCLASLVISIVFAGIGSKGFKSKVTKSLGSVYGIINYFSDIMSYIRVFGLMLSSALIGSVVNMLAEMVSGSAGIGYVFAALILILFHVFNLVMGVLSVFIHNGRLQYVEFFGKFYTGDGMLFVPFGSDTKYTLLQSQTPSQK